MNRIYFYITWSMVFLVVLLAMFAALGHESALSFGCVLVAFVWAFTIHMVKYDSMSFVTIYLLMNIVTYSLAILGNMLLSSPAIRPDLWADVHFSLQGAIVGLSAFSLGVWYSNRKGSNKTTHLLSTTNIPPTKGKFNFLLAVISLSCVALVQLALGLYYHSSIGVYNFSNAGVNNLLSYVLWIGYIGIFLQVNRFAKTRNIHDAIVALVLICVAILLFLPSGSRERAFGFMPLLVLAYLAWEKRHRYAYIFMGTIFGLLVIGVITVGVYRSNKFAQDSGFIEQLTMLDEARVSLASNSSSAAILIGRLSDFAPVGRIINWTPDIRPYRYFEGMQYWWRIILPGAARTYFDQPLNFNEGPETTYKYCISLTKTSSNPSMNIGSLFSRFGWVGLAAGMFILGIILRKFDFALNRSHPLFRFILWLLLAKIIWRLYASSSLTLFVTFTRDLIVCYVFSWLIFKMLLALGALSKCVRTRNVPQPQIVMRKYQPVAKTNKIEFNHH